MCQRMSGHRRCGWVIGAWGRRGHSGAHYKGDTVCRFFSWGSRLVYICPVFVSVDASFGIKVRAIKLRCIMASAYSFEHYDTYTQVCASTPRSTTMHNFVTYSTNVSGKKYHDLERFQGADVLVEEAGEDEVDVLHPDDDDLFQIEDVDTCNYTSKPKPSCGSVAGSLPSLMLDGSSDEESDDDYDVDDDMAAHDDSDACRIIASHSACADEWNQAIISPYLHPRNASSNPYLKKQQLTFDSILPHTQHPAATLTSVAADNYNLWLSSN